MTEEDAIKMQAEIAELKQQLEEIRKKVSPTAEETKEAENKLLTEAYTPNENKL